MNPQIWKLIKSKEIVGNVWGRGINIYEDKKPIYIPILTIEDKKLDYVNVHFYKALKTYEFFNSNTLFDEKIKIIKEISNQRFYDLEHNKKNIGNYLELLILRNDYVNFYPKDPNFKIYDKLLNSNNKFTEPFLNLIRYFSKLNDISYEVHNSQIN